MTYNIDQIVKIMFRVKEIDFEYEYVPAKKNIFGKTTPEFYKSMYYGLTNNKYYEEDFKNPKYIIENKEIWLNHRVIVWFASQEVKVHYFDSYQEGVDFKDKIIGQMPRRYQKL